MMKPVGTPARQRTRIRGFDALVAACARAFDPVRRPPAPADACDAERLVELARRHRVQGLITAGLGASAPPPLAVEAQQIAVHNLRAAAESARLKQAFEETGIELLFIKGLTLGTLAWPNPSAKMSWDIDVLVAPAAVKAAAALLEHLAYRRIVPGPGASLSAWHRGHKESVWFHPASGLHLELHTGLADNAAVLPTVNMSSPQQLVEVASSIVLPTLAPAPLFAYLCVHGASSAWFRLKWIADLAALLHRAGPNVSGRWCAQAEEFTSRRAIGQAILLGERLFGPLVPPATSTSLAADPVTRWLADRAEDQLAGPRALAEPTQRRLGTLTIHVTQLALRPGWRFAAGELRRQLVELRGR
jgi:hypothetical protein